MEKYYFDSLPTELLLLCLPDPKSLMIVISISPCLRRRHMTSQNNAFWIARYQKDIPLVIIPPNIINISIMNQYLFLIFNVSEPVENEWINLSLLISGITNATKNDTTDTGIGQSIKNEPIENDFIYTHPKRYQDDFEFINIKYWQFIVDHLIDDLPKLQFFYQSQKDVPNIRYLTNIICNTALLNINIPVINWILSIDYNFIILSDNIIQCIDKINSLNNLNDNSRYSLDDLVISFSGVISNNIIYYLCKTANFTILEKLLVVCYRHKYENMLEIVYPYIRKCVNTSDTANNILNAGLLFENILQNMHYYNVDRINKIIIDFFEYCIATGYLLDRTTLNNFLK
jgi:hypothetical protein